MAASQPEPPPSSVPHSTQNRPPDPVTGPHSSSRTSTSVTTQIPSAPPNDIYIPTPTRFQFPFPDLLDNLFKSFDDRFIRYAQHRTTGIVHFCAMALTVFTAIETSLFAPSFLFALGYDAAGGLSASVLLILGIISQMPKKFIFRARPWMVGRALPIRRDKTSSFPSRAVVCAVVFSWLFARSLELEGLLGGPLSPVHLWMVIVVVASLAAAARVNVGAHYPSDTVLGFLLGCLIIRIGVHVENAWQGIGCSARMIYANEVAEGAESLGMRWSLHNFLLVTAVAFAMTLVSIQGFWVKCSYVYGLLMASMAFRASFLCVTLGDGSRMATVARITRYGTFREHLAAAGFFMSIVFFGMATRGMKGWTRVVTFSLIYSGTMLGITYWRVR